MSKQDTHFFNVFSVVIGLLVSITVCLFALARIVAGQTQDRQVLTYAAYGKHVEQRIQPPSHEAIAGHDNSALAIKAEGARQGGTAAPVALPKSGADVYNQVCSTCHGQGIAGAPKVGDKAAWGPRIITGKPTLYEHALKGYQGSSGVMPAKGGRPDMPDELVRQAVDYMVQMAK